MKILKEGKIPGEKKYAYNCHNCGTIFEFRKDEAEFVSDYRNGGEWKIVCPLCKIDCWIHELK